VFLWMKNHRRSTALVAVTLLLPAYLLMSILGQLLVSRAAYSEQIDAIEPRIASMQGLIAHQATLQEATAAANAPISDHVYPRRTDGAAVAVALQSEARSILADAGMQVTNSQVLPVRKRDAFDYVAVKVVAKGSLSQLNAGLSGFTQFRPVMLVESIDIFPSRRRGDDSQVLTVSVQLLSLRVTS